MPGGGFSQQGERYEATVTYIPVDDFDKQPNRIPAFTVYPIRMVVVHASFPLREQLEEIKRALRLNTIEEARQQSIPGTNDGRRGCPGRRRSHRVVPVEDGDDRGPAAERVAAASGGPMFAGFEVERRITAPNGHDYDWAKYDHEERLRRHDLVPQDQPTSPTTATCRTSCATTR